MKNPENFIQPPLFPEKKEEKAVKPNAFPTISKLSPDRDPFFKPAKRKYISYKDDEEEIKEKRQSRQKPSEKIIPRREIAKLAAEFIKQLEEKKSRNPANQLLKRKSIVIEEK